MENKSALNILLVSLIAVIMFHIAILIKIVPYNIAWGGRLQNDAEMYVFESISIVINSFFVLVLLMVGDDVKYKFN